jgi:membrane-associated phospholipid phosphatase
MSIDLYLFQTINDLAFKNPFWDQFFVFAAEKLIWVEVAGAVVVLLVRKRLRCISFTLIGGLIISRLIRLFYFRPRPFVDGAVNVLIQKSGNESSFPSEHALIAWAIAAGVWLGVTWGIVAQGIVAQGFRPEDIRPKGLSYNPVDIRPKGLSYNPVDIRPKGLSYKGLSYKGLSYKVLSCIFLITALLISFSRIYVGVHYPSDILASMLIAFVVAYVVKILSEHKEKQGE